jgi:hypothetical protein
VVCSDWSVPLRVDQGFRPLDQSGSEWPGSAGTNSISDLIRTARSRSDGQKREREGMLTG